MRLYLFLCYFLLASMLTPARPARAVPFVPSSGAQVLERLPFKPNDPMAREITQLRAQMRQHPNDVGSAVELARRYYELVADEGDPRYLGYAQAVLAPWWHMDAPPTEVQLLRASLFQFRHEFAAAVKDLTQVLAREPGHAQARVLRATIHIVQARYQEARIDCLALQGRVGALIVDGCVAMVDGLTGKAQAAYQSLNAAVSARVSASDGEKQWTLLRLAELAQRIGQTDAAIRHFEQAAKLGANGTFLLSNYADLLLDQKRPLEVVALLKEKIRSDSLLLRLTLALQASDPGAAKASAATLAQRYAAAQARGDTAHQQEEARFALQIEHDPRKALKLAQENWKVQLEPRDARIFLEAALALKDPAAAAPVLKWLKDNQNEDQVLLGLARQLQQVGQ